MKTLLALSVISFGLITGCGGSVASSSSSNSSDGGAFAGNSGWSGSTVGTLGPGVADGASSIEVQTATLGEAPVGGAGSDQCAPSTRTIDVNLATGDLVAQGCVIETNVGDADAGAMQASMQIVKQKTLGSAALDHLKSTLAGYHATDPPAKNTCGYDGTAFLLKVTGSADPVTYWDDAYNCEYPDDVKWVTPRLNPLFAELDAE